MNIGIDVDGVIIDTENWMHAYAEVFDVDGVNTGIVNRDGVFVEDMYDWDRDVFDAFVKKYGYFVQEVAPILPCAKMVMDWLKTQGHKLIVVTARGKWGETEKEITERTFEKYGLEFDKVCYGSQDKPKVCKENNIDYMIEDSPKNIDRLDAEGVKCLYLRDLDHKRYNSPNIIEVSNWGEIYRFFKEHK